MNSLSLEKSVVTRMGCDLFVSFIYFLLNLLHGALRLVRENIEKNGVVSKQKFDY